MKYKTGGKHEPSNVKEGGTPVDVGMKGAGYGTHMGPNTKDYHPLPGGKGSTGGKSTSTPKG